MYKRFLHYCKKRRDNLIKTSDILCAGLIATHKGPSTNYTAPNSGCVCSYCNRVMPNQDNSDKSVANKTESVKRKITDLSLEDNESLDSPSAGKKPTGSLKTPEKMAGANSSHVLAPAKFTVPSNDDLDRAIEDHVHQESMDSENEQGAVGGTSTFASKAKKAKVDYPFALYIVAGTDQERKPMTRAHFVEFDKYLSIPLEGQWSMTIWRSALTLRSGEDHMDLWRRSLMQVPNGSKPTLKLSNLKSNPPGLTTAGRINRLISSVYSYQAKCSSRRPADQTG